MMKMIEMDYRSFITIASSDRKREFSYYFREITNNSHHHLKKLQYGSSRKELLLIIVILLLFQKSFRITVQEWSVVISIFSATLQFRVNYRNRDLTAVWWFFLILQLIKTSYLSLINKLTQCWSNLLTPPPCHIHEFTWPFVIRFLYSITFIYSLASVVDCCGWQGLSWCTTDYSLSLLANRSLLLLFGRLFHFIPYSQRLLQPTHLILLFADDMLAGVPSILFRFTRGRRLTSCCSPAGNLYFIAQLHPRVTDRVSSSAAAAARCKQVMVRAIHTIIHRQLDRKTGDNG